MKRRVGALEKVEADLGNLQEKIRRDAPSYKDDFINQYSQYSSFLSLFLQAPTSTDEQGIISLRELIDFVAHVADCYPQATKTFPADLVTLLTQHHAVLEPELRDKIVSSLVLLRKKDIIDSARSVGRSSPNVFTDSRQPPKYALPTPRVHAQQNPARAALPKDYLRSQILQFQVQKPQTQSNDPDRPP